jgi:hypothetical protein
MESEYEFEFEFGFEFSSESEQQMRATFITPETPIIYIMKMPKPPRPKAQKSLGGDLQCSSGPARR